MALAHAVLAAELVDATAGIEDLLLAGVKRMTRRAHFNREVIAKCRTGTELVTATTGYFDVTVIGMNFGFHV